MALTPFQLRVCRLLAEQRRRSGESYVAGGVALNELLAGTRRSRDIDLFHDTEEAVAASWAQDRAALAGAGLLVEPTREHPRGELLRASPADLPEALSRNRVRFHEGRIRGAFPEVR